MNDWQNITVGPAKRGANRERELQKAISEWLLAKHPAIMFVNMPDDVRKTWQWQDHNHYPDMAIYQPAGSFHGLFIEFKRDRKTLFRQNGKIRQNKHLKSQIECMKKLIDRGYLAVFVWEVSQGVDVIEQYLSHRGNP